MVFNICSRRVALAHQKAFRREFHQEPRLRLPHKQRQQCDKVLRLNQLALPKSSLIWRVQTPLSKIKSYAGNSSSITMDLAIIFAAKQSQAPFHKARTTHKSALRDSTQSSYLAHHSPMPSTRTRGRGCTEFCHLWHMETGKITLTIKTIASGSLISTVMVLACMPTPNN